MANRDSNPDMMNAFKRQSSTRSSVSSKTSSKCAHCRNEGDSSNQETVPKSSKSDSGTYLREYISLLCSLEKMVENISKGRIKIQNVQFGNGNTLNVNKGANDNIINALSKILVEQRDIKDTLHQKYKNISTELAQNKLILTQMEEQMENGRRMLKNIRDTGDQTAETMSKLTDLIQAMSKEKTDFLTDSMSTFVAEIKGNQGDELSENGQKTFSYILQNCGEGNDEQVWDYLAYELGVEVTVHSNPEDTCMKILLDWLKANEDKDSGQLVNTLLSALQKVESKRDANEDDNNYDDNIPEETRQLNDVTQKFRTIEAHLVLLVQRVTEMQRQLQQLLDTNQSVITTHM